MHVSSLSSPTARPSPTSRVPLRADRAIASPKHRLSGLQSKDQTIVKHGLDSPDPEVLQRVSSLLAKTAYDVRAQLAPPSFAQVGGQLDASANSTNPPSLVSSRRPSAGNAVANNATAAAAAAGASRPSSPPPRAMSPSKAPASTKVSHNTLSGATNPTFSTSANTATRPQPPAEPTRVPSSSGAEHKEKPKEKESKGIVRRMLSGVTDKDKQSHADGAAPTLAVNAHRLALPRASRAAATFRL